MSSKIYLGLDPSGNFREGKGTTGWCLYSTKENKFIKVGAIKAEDFTNIHEYWQAHTNLINEFFKQYRKSLTIVIEDYVLYAHKAANQINSQLETPRLLGVLQQYCYNKNIAYCMQLASLVKTRWADDILLRKKVFTKRGNKLFLTDLDLIINKHTKDAIRHVMHFKTFRKEKK